jgi:DNA-binding NarL/FixJ family response regulator
VPPENPSRIRVQLVEGSDHLNHAVELLLGLQDGFELVTGAPADVVLIDLRRPLGRSFRTLLSLRDRPVVALARDAIQARAALDMGAREAVIKSDGAAAFLSAVRRVAAPAAEAAAA